MLPRWRRWSSLRGAAVVFEAQSIGVFFFFHNCSSFLYFSAARRSPGLHLNGFRAAHCVGAVCAHIHSVFAVQHPFAPVIETQLLRGNRDLYGSFFSGSNLHPPDTLQELHRTVIAIAGAVGTDINLNDLCTCSPACIFDGGFDCNGSVIHRNIGAAELEAGIAEAVAKGVGSRFSPLCPAWYSRDSSRNRSHRASGRYT